MSGRDAVLPENICETALERTAHIRPWKAWGCLTLAMSIAGSAVVAGKLMVGVLPVFLAAALGLGAGLLVMLPMLWLRRETAPLDLRTHATLAVQALCGIALYRICTFAGLQYTSAAAAGLMSSAAPAIICLLAWGLLRERPPLRRIGGIACVSVGLLLVNAPPLLERLGGAGGAETFQAGQALLGNGLVLLAVVCEAAFSVLSKARCQPMSPLRRTTIVSFYALLMLLPLAGREAWAYDFGSMGLTGFSCVLYYGVAVSYLSYVLWFKGIAVVPASSAAPFTGLVPISGMAFSWLVLHEDLLWTHLAGLSCVVCGIWFSCAAGGGECKK